MAQSKRSAASYVAESRNTKKKNPFTGKTLAEMKKMWRGMTPAQRKANEKNFVNAAKTAPKSKPAAPKPRQTTKEEAKSRFYRSSSGIRGEFRKVGDPGPNVSRDPQKFDPTSRRVRRVQEDARRSRVRASGTAGRRNIARQVAEQSGSAKRNQRQVEARRRRAREEAAKRNRRLMLSRKYNKD